jgi:hypothetical protein
MIPLQFSMLQTGKGPAVFRSLKNLTFTRIGLTSKLSQTPIWWINVLHLQTELKPPSQFRPLRLWVCQWLALLLKKFKTWSPHTITSHFSNHRISVNPSVRFARLLWTLLVIQTAIIAVKESTVPSITRRPTTMIWSSMKMITYCSITTIRRSCPAITGRLVPSSGMSRSE